MIDFGVTGNPALNPPNGIRASVKLQGPGCGGQGCPMTYAGPASSPTESYWTAAAGAFVGPTIRTHDVFDRLETKPASVTHSRTFGGVANPFVANDKSGSSALPRGDDL